jgi:hypothetical protein
MSAVPLSFSLEHLPDGRRLVSVRCRHFEASTTYNVDVPYPPDYDTAEAIRKLALELHQALAPCDCAGEART